MMNVYQTSSAREAKKSNLRIEQSMAIRVGNSAVEAMAVRHMRYSDKQEVAVQTKSSGVSDETIHIIKRMHARGMKMRDIAKCVGLAGEKHGIFQALFLFLSRVAEPLMFFATLYVIAETVLPGLFKAPAFVQASHVSIIVLNTAPEVILPGCFMQAGMAEEQQRWMYKAMGVLFIALTFVTLASFIWDFPAGAVSVILFFRCAAAVLYSLLVRMTPQGQQYELVNRHQQAQLVELTQTFTQQIRCLETDIDRRLTEAVSTVQTDFQSSMETLSTLPELNERLAQVESDSCLRFQRVSTDIESLRAQLNKSALMQAGEPQKKKKGERPVLHALPQRVATSEGKFDIRSFVFACLEENAAATIESIQLQALSKGQSISTGSISRYRKQYSEKSAVPLNPSGERKIEAESKSNVESA